ncbi:hypothetical protein O181_066964 [Austropuccinia psidii MF-1]|uniref:Uncharacterized protein n=1 Tax=Austropuccinia psidii MF-1 TaxID=1389203 RepID=A0A9Q3EU01_9BASI|nr:hypothetical protein [Austropuccinia psidii MF-1]
MRQKGDKEAVHNPPSVGGAHNPKNPKMAKRPQDTQIGHNQTWTPFSTHVLWQPSVATSSVQSRLPLNSGEDFSFINGPHTKGLRHGAYMV